MRKTTAALLLGLLCIIVLGLRTATSFSIVDVNVTGQHAEGDYRSLPLRLDTGEERSAFEAAIHADVSLFSPRTYRIDADECLTDFAVDGHRLNENLPFCSWGEGIDIFVGDLTPGRHTFRAWVENDGGEMILNLYPSYTDPITVIRVVATMLLILAVLLAIAWIAGGKAAMTAPVTLAAVLGILIRIAYWMRTPYWVRGHDTDGHIEYIQYIAQHWAIPPANEGWEFWQPPVYYILGGFWYGIGSWLGRAEVFLLQDLQLIALLFAIGSLLLAIPASRLLFPGNRIAQVIVMGTVAVLPGLVFMGARINNDVPVHFLSMLGLTLLLSWWKHPRATHWYGAILALTLGVLTKSSALALLPLPFLLLLFHVHIPRLSKFRKGAAALALIALIAGGFSAYRSLTDASPQLVGNTGNLSDGLIVRKTPRTLLTFNPLELVANPFNNPWDDGARRNYQWEYLYRSAFFGEFDFPSLGFLTRLMMLFSLPMLALALIGWARTLRQRMWVPIHLANALLLSSYALYQLLQPFSSSQDFRYVTPLVFVGGAFIAAGCAKCSERWQGAFAMLLAAFWSSCAVFLAVA